MEAEPFYDEFAPKEWERLERHRTEFAVSLRAISEFLPRPPYSVLDVGGGPGRYSIELARQGYSVTLLDISGENLRLARQKANEAQVSLADVIHANAVDLSKLGSARLRRSTSDGAAVPSLVTRGKGSGDTRGNACSQAKREAVRSFHHAIRTVSVCSQRRT